MYRLMDSVVIHNATILWAETCEQLITVVLNTYDQSHEFYNIKYEWVYDINSPKDHVFFVAK